RLRHDRAVPRRVAGRAWTERHRPRRRGARPAVSLLPAWIIAPLLLPLMSAALLLLLGDEHRRLRGIANVAASAGGLVIAVLLLIAVDAGGSPGKIGVYLASNWAAPFGIV